MRLRSNFHDYYDTVLAEGHDSAIQYLRFPKEVELDSFKFSTCGGWFSKLSCRTHVIGFCDNVHYLLEVNLAGNSDMFKSERSKRRYCYSVEDVDSFVKANFKDREFEDYMASEAKWVNGRRWNSGWRSGGNRRNIADFFKVNKMGAGDHFKDHPIFVASNRESYGEKPKIVYNAQLKPFEFYRIYDPFQAFQTLSQWLGNKAVPMKEIPVMSDEIKIGARGFDKWSFRKEPTKKA